MDIFRAILTLAQVDEIVTSTPDRGPETAAAGAVATRDREMMTTAGLHEAVREWGEAARLLREVRHRYPVGRSIRRLRLSDATSAYSP